MRDPFVTGMATVRFISAGIEMAGAFFILRSGRVNAALRVNGLLGLVGPIILVTVTALGVAGMAGRIQIGKMLLIFIGVYLILFGSR